MLLSVFGVILLVVIISFGGVLLFGAPYLPTLRQPAEDALKLLALKPDQTLLELGSGDGKMLVLAASKGLNVVGIELNPILAAISWLRTRRYRKQVHIICGNFWQTEWPTCDAVYVFLLDRFMPRLDKRMQKVQKPLASFAFKIPLREPDSVQGGVYLYRYDKMV